MFSPTDHNIGQLRALRNAGFAKIAIALQLNCSKSTVNKWFSRFQVEDETGEETADQQKFNRGRPEKLTAENV